MEKTIIVLQGTANVGKSMTLARLGHVILRNGGSTTHNINFQNYRATFDYQNVKVGLQTFGDFEQAILEGLDIFDSDQCEIIIIASKRYGATVNAIKNYATSNFFRVIWGSTHWRQGTDSEIEELKEYSANQYDRMITDIIQGNL